MNDLARMTAWATELGQVDGLRAYAKPGEAMANRPCLLVLPPAEDTSTGSAGHPGFEWTFALLSSKSAGSYDAVAELAPLAELIRPRLDYDTRRYSALALPTSTGTQTVTACLFTFFEIP